MSISRTTGGQSFGPALYFLLSFMLGSYFTFAAVQGDYGLFQRVQIIAETDVLRAERDHLRQQLQQMENRTLRLSDGYLDLDLLDEQARDRLGLLRNDERIIH